MTANNLPQFRRLGYIGPSRPLSPRELQSLRDPQRLDLGRIREFMVKVEDAARLLAADLGREATDDEVAQFLDVNAQRIVEARHVLTIQT